MTLCGRVFVRFMSGEARPYIDCGRERTTTSGEPGGDATMVTADSRKGGLLLTHGQLVATISSC